MTDWRIEWFCTTCKKKFTSDRDHPHCMFCESGYVLRNEPIAYGEQLTERKDG